jgi:hypothetical protein
MKATFAHSITTSPSSGVAVLPSSVTCTASSAPASAGVLPQHALDGVAVDQVHQHAAANTGHASEQTPEEGRPELHLEKSGIAESRRLVDAECWRTLCRLTVHEAARLRFSDLRMAGGGKKPDARCWIFAASLCYGIGMDINVTLSDEEAAAMAAIADAQKITVAEVLHNMLAPTLQLAVAVYQGVHDARAADSSSSQ